MLRGFKGYSYNKRWSLAKKAINVRLTLDNKKKRKLTQDEKFWAGCKSCVNYDILMMKERKNCLCTAMLFDPKDHYEPKETQEHFEQNSKLYERLLKIKQSKFLKRLKGPDKNGNEVRHTNRKLKMSFFNFLHQILP